MPFLQTHALPFYRLQYQHIVGGGGCLIRNFGKYDESRVTIEDDICATAKGYEFLAERQMQKGLAGK